MVERGGCYDVDKLQAAQRAGATGVLVANNNAEGYFNLDAPNGRVPRDLVIPAAAIPKSVGHIILMSLTLLKPLQVRDRASLVGPTSIKATVWRVLSPRISSGIWHALETLAASLRRTDARLLLSVRSIRFRQVKQTG